MFHVHVQESAESAAAGATGGSSALVGPGTSAKDTTKPPESNALLDALPDSIHFSVGALNVEVLQGTLQLFREQGIPIGEAPGQSRTLCVVAVPPHLSVSDFVLFVGPYADKIEHIRILRDTRKSAVAAGRYMVLLRFVTQKAADAFYRGYQGKPFSSFDTEVCHTFYVAQIKVFKLDRRLRSKDTSGTANPSSGAASGSEHLQQLVSSLAPSDPLASALVADAPAPTSVLAASATVEAEVLVETCATTPATTAAAAGATSEAGAASAGGESSGDGDKSGLVELPTCPVCLERLDAATSGIVTTLCGHSFDCACLSRWTSDQCPVCRYTLADEDLLLVEDQDDDGDSAEGSGTGGSSAQGRRAGGTASAAACETCAAAGHPTARENVWMCLICGHLGCGRLARGHALAHFRRTHHAYAIDLVTQRVWDYVGDGFVHRILQNRSDGKLVEVPDPTISNGFGGGASSSSSASDAYARSRLPPSEGGPIAIAGLSHKWKKLGDDDDGDDDDCSPAYASSAMMVAMGRRAAEASSKKDQAVAFDYALLLTGQLEAQRQYFESILARILSVIPEEDHHAARSEGNGGGGGGAGSAGACSFDIGGAPSMLRSVRRAVESIVSGDEEGLVEAVMEQSLFTATRNSVGGEDTPTSALGSSGAGAAGVTRPSSPGAVAAAVAGASTATGNAQLRRAVINEERRLREAAFSSGGVGKSKKKKAAAASPAAPPSESTQPALLPGGPVQLRPAPAATDGTDAEAPRVPREREADEEDAEEGASESVGADLSWKALERRISKGLTSSSAVDMIRSLRRRCDDLEEAVKDQDRRLTNEAKLRRQYQKQCEELLPKAAKHEEEVRFLKEMNETLEHNQKNWEGRFALAEKQYKLKLEQCLARERDLEEQVRDLMLNFEALRKIEEACAGSDGLVSKEEVAEGKLVMAAAAPGAGSSSGGTGGLDFEISTGGAGGRSSINSSSTAARLKQKLALSRQPSSTSTSAAMDGGGAGDTHAGVGGAADSPRSARREKEGPKDSVLSASASGSTVTSQHEDDDWAGSGVVAATGSTSKKKGSSKK